MHAFIAKPLLGTGEQLFEDPLPCLVMDNELSNAVALGRGVLRVAPHIEIQPCAIAQENIAAAAPGNDPPEQVAGDLVRAQPTLPSQGAGDAVLVLDPEDPSLHADNLTGPARRSAVACR